MLYNLNDISLGSSVKAEELDNAVNKIKEGNRLSGLGRYFIKAQEDYNVNALVLFAVACLESGYGLSELAITKNNLFGIGARDSLKGTAAYGDKFDTLEECIDHAGHRIGKQYLELDESKSYRYCGGRKDVWSVGKKWCSKSDWGDKISNICSRLEEIIIGVRAEYPDEESENYKELYLTLKDKLDRIREVLEEE